VDRIPIRAVFVLLLAAGCSSRPAALITPVMPASRAIAHAEVIEPLSSGVASRGREAFVELQCHACHRVAEDAGLPELADAWEGPVLSNLGELPPEAVGWKITTRAGSGPESEFESPMVEAASQMTARQLVDIIAYLRDPVSASDQKEDLDEQEN
jgi:mono/diheme cytochrome c family protein